MYNFTDEKFNILINYNLFLCVLTVQIGSLGGSQPYIPVSGYEDDDLLNAGGSGNVEMNSGYQKARVLCSYDAKDGTELNLTANEVSPANLTPNRIAI
jgi:endophilin-B